MNETVAAISTPRGMGGVGMIRISGPEALAVAGRVFYAYDGRPPAAMEGCTCAVGRVADETGAPVDEAVLTVFRAPKSYTGEDVAELSCHGGVFLLEEVLRLVFAAGAAPAGPGEFTKRAFLNGKLSLDEAEAVIDLIEGDSRRQLAAAMQARTGAVSRLVDAAADRLIYLSGELAAWIDYPEEDIADVDAAAMQEGLLAAARALDSLISRFSYGKILGEGLATVIAGAPNVGKSTLMNLLSGEERSIVTDLPGTTRDVVEERIRLGEITLRLADTAGLRETDDPVESLGVQRSRQKLAAAGLVLAVFDASRPLTGEEARLLAELKASGSPRVLILNKCDLPRQLEPGAFAGEPVVELSARTGEGFDALVQAILQTAKAADGDEGAPILLRERQRRCVQAARRQVGEALEALEAGFTWDAVTVCIDSAIDSLLELTGRKASEAVVEEVFSRFCVGK